MPNDIIRASNIIRKQWIYPILIWLIYVGYETVTAHIILGKVSSTSTILLHYILNVGLFYAHALFVFPLATRHKKNKAVWLVLLTILEVIVYLVIDFALCKILRQFGLPPMIFGTENLESFLPVSLWRASYFLALSTSYWFWLRSVSTEKRIFAISKQQLLNQKQRAVLEKSNLQLKNAYIQSQINPHLYFNTLNFVYNAVHNASPKAGEAIMLLSDLSRYALRQVDVNGRVRLTEEIENIYTLIKINQIRYHSELNITFEAEDNFNNWRIIPLVLISFVENVFKYGELEDKTKQAAIIAKKRNDDFFFETTNYKKRQYTKPGTGIGIKTSKLRLENAYGNAFYLNIEETDEKFNVQLCIKARCL